MVEWSKTSDSGSDLRMKARVRIPILSNFFTGGRGCVFCVVHCWFLSPGPSFLSYLCLTLWRIRTLAGVLMKANMINENNCTNHLSHNRT